MGREYEYVEVLMGDFYKGVLRIEGYRNIKHASKDGINKEVDRNGKSYTVNLSKK